MEQFLDPCKAGSRLLSACVFFPGAGPMYGFPGPMYGIAGPMYGIGNSFSYGFTQVD